MKKAKISTTHQPLHLLRMCLGFGEFPGFWTILLPSKHLNLFQTCQNLACQALAAQEELLGCNNRLFPLPVLLKSPKFCRKRGGFRAHTLPLPAPAKPLIPIILTSTSPSKQIRFHLQTELLVSPKTRNNPSSSKQKALSLEN